MKSQKEKKGRAKKRIKPFGNREIQILYFFLKNSILDAKLDNSKLYLGLLKQAYRLNSQVFKASLENWQKQDLILLEKQILKKNLFKTVEPSDYYETIKPISDPIPEKQIVEYLYNSNLEKLTSVLGIKHPRFGGSEVRTDTGRVDLIVDDVLEQDYTRYLIEFKTHMVDHKVIGQVRKYEIYYLKRLMYRIWNKVRVVVVAHGFHRYIIAELKKANAIPVLYHNSSDKITFQSI